MANSEMFARLTLATRSLRRSYVPLNQIAIWKQDRFHFIVPTLIDCKAHRDFLVSNEDQVPPNIISYSLDCMVRRNLLLDNYWPDICMLVKRQLKTYDRHVAPHVYRVASAMAQLGEKNQELWQLIEDKLLKEALVRYLSESQCAELLSVLATAEIGSDQLHSRLLDEVKLHCLELSAAQIKMVLAALEITGKGDAATIHALQEGIKQVAISA